MYLFRTGPALSHKITSTVLQQIYRVVTLAQSNKTIG